MLRIRSLLIGVKLGLSLLLMAGALHGVQGAAQPTGTPTPTDITNLNPMTAGAIAMFAAADAMDDGADQLDAEGITRNDPALREHAAHWRVDARTLRDRGIWMLLSQTADSMAHDPDRAHHLDLRSLKANGDSMIVEGESMIEHGHEMLDEVVELHNEGILLDGIYTSLAEAADLLITAGEQIKHDGEDMRDYAERMLDSLGE